MLLFHGLILGVVLININSEMWGNITWLKLKSIPNKIPACTFRVGKDSRRERLEIYHNARSHIPEVSIIYICCSVNITFT
jgi:hypothetical protein